MTRRQGGIKLCFLSSLSLTLSLSPFVLHLYSPLPHSLTPSPLPPDGKGQLSSGEYLWARESNWFEIIRQGRKKRSKGGRERGQEKKRTWQRHGDKGRDGVYILMFKFNLPHTRWILRLSSYCYVSSVFRCACQYCTYTLYLGGVESTQALRKALQIEASFSLGLTHSVGDSRGNKGTFTDP